MNKQKWVNMIKTNTKHSVYKLILSQKDNNRNLGLSLINNIEIIAPTSQNYFENEMLTRQPALNLADSKF